MNGVLIQQDGTTSVVKLDKKTTVAKLLGSEFADHRSLRWLDGRGSSLRGYKLTLFFHDSFSDADAPNEVASRLAGFAVEGPAFLVDDNSTLTTAEVDGRR
jgi:hypothetical protein